MQSANLLQQYKTQSLETLTKGEIVVKLFEEASKQVSTAIFLTSRGEAVKAYNCIAKAQKVISALDKSLDRKFAISVELDQLYMFIHGQLSQAILNKDTDLLKRLLKMIDELKVTFRQAEKLARASRRT
jgi:Flagellin-specific chaperone FliS